jgi:hypothetical protein
MGCTSLTWLSLPEGLKTIDGKAFQGCKNLRAVYLPSTLEKIVSTDWSGAFGDCTNMYLTSTPIVYAGENTVIPEKEAVYYMPASLSTVTTGAYGGPFSFCKNLNSVIVFGTNFKNASVNDGMFKSSGTATNPISIVFLGEITALRVNSQSQDGAARTNYVSYYFMNPNNTDISSLDFANTHVNNSILEAYLYFCRSGKAYAIKGKNDSHYAYLEDVVAPHLAKTIKITEATCLTNEVRVTTCFCEHVMNTEIIENSALVILF